jgi:GTP cyclohydrolase IIa
VELASYIRTHHDSIAHFVGGDNVIAACPPLLPETFEGVREHVQETVGVDLQVGVGRGMTAHAAGHRAKLALEDCRESGSRIRHVTTRSVPE